VHRALLLVALIGCGPSLQTVQLVNHTSRTITELYIYPSGAANHGSSRGSLAPEGSKSVSVARGHVEVLAVSDKMKIDEHTRDKPSASSGVELTGPVQIVFYDSGNKPAGLDRPGVIGVAFILAKPVPAPPDADQK
jgi:hypothetical protein